MVIVGSPMAEFQVVVLKSIPFQGVEEEYSNVYTLTTDFGEQFADEAAIDSIVGLERGVHATTVRFLSAVSYEGVGGNLTPRFRKFIDLPGQQSPTTNMYHECAVLCTIELPRSGLFGLGRRRFLRKWLHTGCGNIGANSMGGNGQTGSGIMSSAYTTAMLNTYWTPMVTAEHGGGLLSATNGDRPISLANARISPYLEHRQFHR